jgi:anaerobic selenocysteine-containing dehydrogenase/ferredoxin-NADP reductase
MGSSVTKRGYCTLCRSRCGAVYTVERGRLLAAEPDPDHPTGSALCAKGRAAPELVHNPRRLTRPLRRTRPKTDPDPCWEEISWEAALDEIAGRMDTIRREDGPEAVAFAVTSPSGTPLSDGIDWVERFIRLFGSPNTAYATEICNWHKDHAHAFTFGCGIPTADYAHADLVLLWGHNPARSWLAQATAIGQARARGARVAVVDPRRAGSAQTADLWLRVRPGSDGALALGVANLLIEQGRYDDDFLRSWTNAPLLVRDDTGKFLRAADVFGPGTSGFVAWDGSGPVGYDTERPAVRPGDFVLTEGVTVPTAAGPVGCTPAFLHYARACAEWTPDRVAATTWTSENDVRALAEAIAEAGSVAYHSWSGVGQHTNATQTERAIATLYALTGSFDQPGGNVIWPRVPANPITSFDQLSATQRAKALGIDVRPLGPPAQGWVTAHDLYTAILEQRPYRVRALFGFGANILVSQADTRRGVAALRNLEFQVHCDLALTPTAETADIVLPVNTPWEREALKTGFEISHEAQQLVQLRQRMVDPIGESRSDTEIVFALAERLGMGAEFFDGSIDRAWEHVLEPLPFGLDELRARPEGIQVPLEASFGKHAAVNDDGTVAGFATPTRRVELYSERFLAHGYDPVPRFVEPRDVPDEDYPFVLASTKNSKFCHSQHRGLASLRRRSPEPTVELSPELAATKDIDDGDWVVLATRHGRIRMRAHLDDSLHPGVVVSEYGWWQSAPDLGLPGYDPFSDEGSNFNRLVDGRECDPISGSVPLRSVSCDVERDPVRNAHRWVGRTPVLVADVVNESVDAVSLHLVRSDSSPLPDFGPGQHVIVHIDRLESQAETGSRTYSLSGTATATDSYRITVRAEGMISDHLVRQLRRGDTVGIEAPSGRFRLPLEPDLPVVLIAGGVGITPFMSYLETLRDSQPEAEVHLLYASRDGRHHIFGERLRELAEEMPGLSLTVHFTRPTGQDRPGVDFDVAGRITGDHVAQRVIDQRARFYLCASNQMMADLRRSLEARGVPPFDIFEERFTSPAPTWVPDPDARHTVVFARSQRSATWQADDGSLLDFAERHGVPIPGGCRAGQCESCAVPVVSGSTRYFVPDADPGDEARCVTCQAAPTSELVLDA